MRKSRDISQFAYSSDAFTLVELMVSVAILSVIVLILTGIFSSTTKAWTSTEGGNERRRSARFLTDLIGSELRGAMLPVELASESGKANLQFLINPPTSQVPADFQNPHSIFWQAPLATERTLGDVAEVGYFVKWDMDNGKAAPSLRRFFVNPTQLDSTTQAVRPNPNFLIYSGSGTNWLSEGLLQAVAPADKDHSYVGLFAENVLGLWVRFTGIGGKTLTASENKTSPVTSFDSRKGYEIRLPGKDSEGNIRSDLFYLPLSVSISIAQIDAVRAPRLQAAATRMQAIVKDPLNEDANAFLVNLRRAAEQDGQLRALMPGIRVYATDVLLDNGR